MSALRTPTLPRRDTLRAHPQPRAARPKAEYAFIIQNQPASSAPLTSWGTAAHTDGFQTDGTHSNSHTSVTHVNQTQTKQSTDGFCSHHKHSRGATVFRSGQTATRAIKHAIITFEHSNQPIIHSFTHSSTNHSFKQTFITNIHSLHSSIRLNHSSHSFNHSSFNQGQRAGGVKFVEVFEEAFRSADRARGSKEEI